VAEPTVDVRTARLIGNERDGYVEFLGVPYARPPVGPAAFQAPEPLPGSDEVLDCRRYGAAAHRRGAGGGLIPEPAPSGDNPLNLNIWSPSLGATGLPVFVWIHGGGFTGGSNASPWYHGGGFARHGVVAVGINYRLGPEGFLDLGDGNANRGLQDQITALRWIQDNIAAFGGDPSRVTIGGQSAGATSCLALFTSAPARGLFRATAAQSSGGMIPAGPEDARRMAEHYAAALGVGLDPAGLAGASADRRAVVDPDYLPSSAGRRPVWEGLDGAAAFGHETLTWRPTIDGTVVEDDAYRRAASGFVNGEALLVGCTAEEFNSALAPASAPMAEGEVVAAMRTLGLDDSGVAAYLGLGRQHGSLAWGLAQAYTDWRFRIPAGVMAAAAAGSGTAVYRFEFRFASRALGPGVAQARHSSDIPFVWDNLGVAGVAEGVGPDAPQDLADQMHGAWVRFIEGADPWPRYDPAIPQTMVFDAGSALADPGATLATWWGSSQGSARSSKRVETT
jgi:para-nitrobenzyl esterase